MLGNYATKHCRKKKLQNIFKRPKKDEKGMKWHASNKLLNVIEWTKKHVVK